MKRIQKTLLEQMQISDLEISNRLELLGLTRACLEKLRDHQDLIKEHVDTIVDEFYEQQTKVDEIVLLIGDADTLQRLKVAQRQYIIDLFSGRCDSEYVNNRLRIGMVHKRIGVSPKLYLSGVRTLKSLIIGMLGHDMKDRDRLHEVFGILDKLFYFDTTLVFDTYIDSLVSEIDNARQQTENYARSLEDKVAERTEQLELQAKLDPLTNLYNRRAMEDMLCREVKLSIRRGTTLSFVYFDVDDFKKINDKLGHLEGDEVLKTAAKSVQEQIRETDIPCRYGGDEFCIIFPDCKDEDAKAICEKVLVAFNKKYPEFSLSIGVVQSSDAQRFNEDQLIKAADEKMYASKKQKGSFITL